MTDSNGTSLDGPTNPFPQQTRQTEAIAVYGRWIKTFRFDMLCAAFALVSGTILPASPGTRLEITSVVAVAVRDGSRGPSVQRPDQFATLTGEGL